jgi:L-ribulose-5-phosphate 3-epimerase
MADARQTRREWLTTTAAVLAGAALAQGAATESANNAAGPEPRPADRSAPSKKLRIGMCDWSMGQLGKPAAFELGKRVGLDGIQVSCGTPDGMHLRDSKLQKEYLDTARRHGQAIPSVAMGLLNNVPLMSEPKTAVWLADSIEIAKALGARSILVAAFGKGELKADNAEDMRKVTELLVELAPRAEKAGVILGLENYLSAEDNLKIIEKVKSDYVQVYYDVYNAHVTKGYDPIHEIKLLGAKRICEVHLKEGGDLLGGSGKIDWPAVATALKEIRYPGWLILETAAPSGDLVKDTQINLEYARKTFAALANSGSV